MLAAMRGRTERAVLAAAGTLTAIILLVAVALSGLLVTRSLPLLQTQPLAALLLSTEWSPSEGQFGFYPFVAGTLAVTMLALVFAVPLGLLSAVHLAEFAAARTRRLLLPLIDVLAGIPSVVFGVFGIVVLVPLVRDVIAPRFGAVTSGYCLLTGGLVLALMVLPVIIALGVEVLRSVPQELRLASRALGVPAWTTVRRVVLRAAAPQLGAVLVLAFARAAGETMAVLMVVGNVAVLPDSLFSSVYPLPALIANNYGEMMSIPTYDSALLFAALLLLVIVGTAVTVARWSLARLRAGLA